MSPPPPTQPIGDTSQGSMWGVVGWGGVLTHTKKTSNVYIVQDRNVCIEIFCSSFLFFFNGGNAGDGQPSFFMKKIKKRWCI